MTATRNTTMATDLAKQELIQTYLERGIKPGRAEYRIVNTGIPVSRSA